MTLYQRTLSLQDNHELNCNHTSARTNVVEVQGSENPL
jgi:hypothetical protein